MENNADLLSPPAPLPSDTYVQTSLDHTSEVVPFNVDVDDANISVNIECIPVVNEQDETEQPLASLILYPNGAVGEDVNEGATVDGAADDETADDEAAAVEAATDEAAAVEAAADEAAADEAAADKAGNDEAASSEPAGAEATGDEAAGAKAADEEAADEEAADEADIDEIVDDKSPAGENIVNEDATDVVAVEDTDRATDVTVDEVADETTVGVVVETANGVTAEVSAEAAAEAAAEVAREVAAASVAFEPGLPDTSGSTDAFPPPSVVDFESIPNVFNSPPMPPAAPPGFINSSVVLQPPPATGFTSALPQPQVPAFPNITASQTSPISLPSFTDPQQRKYYGVRTGRTVSRCVFLHWEDLYAQVNGCDAADYGAFDTLEEASAYADGISLPPLALTKPKRKRKSHSTVFSPSSKQRRTSSSLAPPPDQVQWEANYAKIVAFHAENGNCNVPRSHPLNEWVVVQRRQYRRLREGHDSRLTAQRLTRLVDLGFVFVLRDKRPVPWSERMEQLRKYREENGHLRVPLSHPTLGRWVNVQRKSYTCFLEGKKSSLTQERVDDLTELGFVFQAGKKRARDPSLPKKSWEERLRQLQEFREEYGHCVVPQLFKGYPGLGRWVHKAGFGIMLQFVFLFFRIEY